MIKCPELNKGFETKELLFAELKANKDLILAEKKSQIQKSCDKGNSLITRSINIAKSLENVKDFNVDDNYYYIAVNSTNILDSHKDLHLNGIWNKTVKEQQGKNFLVADHELKLLSTIANKEDIEMSVQKLPFSAIGKSYKGETEILIYKVAKNKIRESYKEFLEGNIEASVRMQYVTVNLAMNSTAKGDEQELKIYEDNYNLIANKEDFENIDYFFTVSEAKNIKESSLVLFGSNESTGMIQSKSMNMKKNKNIEFIDMMIPHHEMAIKMANDFKDKITNSDLKKIVKNILKSQQNEIEEMNKIKQAEESLVKNEPTIVTQRSKKLFIN